jgi:hypothetical protein
MKQSQLLDHLAQVERHIRDGERHLLRQREILDELERHGRGNSQTAKIARDILATFEMAQSAHLDDRAHLLQALREITLTRNGAASRVARPPSATITAGLASMR